VGGRGHFGQAGSERLYAQWLRHSLEGGADKVYVARQNDDVAGFVTLKCTGDLAQVILLGVNPAQRGLGIGARLLATGLAWAARQAPEVELVTQARNVTALRLYERSGMLVKRVTCFFHLWFE
jgi:dTDP-4-amino-4,6-dideoxy-D-galactose acyltransferase